MSIEELNAALTLQRKRLREYLAEHLTDLEVQYAIRDLVCDFEQAVVDRTIAMVFDHQRRTTP